MHPLINSLLSRRTIRQYKPQAIPSSDLEKIIACAQRAPSGGGLQTYTLVRITDPAVRAQIAHLAGDQAQVSDAPEFFVVCADVQRDKAMIAHRGGAPAEASLMSTMYSLVDATLMAAFMVVAAEALGYGTCCVGGIQNALGEIIRLLTLPQGVLPVMGVCIGMPDEEPAQRPRMPMDVIVRENGYGQLTAEDMARCYAAQAGAASDGDWYRVVNRYLGVGGVMERREEGVRQAIEQQGLWPH